MKIQISETQQKVLFHMGLWSVWLYLSLASARDEEVYNRAVLILSLILTTHIPLFMLNTEWLIPKILLRRGVVIYMLFLAAAFIVFSFLHYHMLEWVNDYLGVMDRKEGKSIKGIVALVLVATISTVYGLLNYFVHLEKRQQEKQQERLQSELSFLRSQISPHFIFNILNGLVYLVRSKSDLAEPVILKLSELMRYMLYESGNAHIPLEKEIAYLENYIALQKIRFEEDVEIRFHMQGAASQQVIEPMLLIPFVENAYKHGVGMVENPVIDIALKLDKNALFLSVKNKMAPEWAAEKDGASGIGLKNVQRRLELLYPHTHSLKIEQENGWFCVTLQLTL